MRDVVLGRNAADLKIFKSQPYWLHGLNLAPPGLHGGRRRPEIGGLIGFVSPRGHPVQLDLYKLVLPFSRKVFSCSRVQLLVQSCPNRACFDGMTRPLLTAATNICLQLHLDFLLTQPGRTRTHFRLTLPACLITMHTPFRSAYRSRSWLL